MHILFEEKDIKVNSLKKSVDSLEITDIYKRCYDPKLVTIADFVGIQKGIHIRVIKDSKGMPGVLILKKKSAN